MTILAHTGERYVPAVSPRQMAADHLGRYNWAARYVAGRRVLDAACGTGYGTALLAAMGAACVLGVDVDPAAVAYAREHCPDASFRAGDVRRLPVGDGEIDTYACLETIEHVHEGEQVLAEAHRVLAPGGLLLLSTPNRAASNPGTPTTWRPTNPYHALEYTYDETCGLLAHQFHLRETWGQVPNTLSRRLLRRAWAAALRLGVEAPAMRLYGAAAGILRPSASVEPFAWRQGASGPQPCYLLLVAEKGR